MIIINFYTMITGSRKIPLDATRSFEYNKPPWMNATREFLKNINASIKIEELKIPTLLQTRNRERMKLAVEYTTSKKQL